MGGEGVGEMPILATEQQVSFPFCHEESSRRQAEETAESLAKQPCP